MLEGLKNRKRLVLDAPMGPLLVLDYTGQSRLQQSVRYLPLYSLGKGLTLLHCEPPKA